MQQEFDDREEAQAWIIKNQFGRRNLSPYQKSALALQLKSITAEPAKEQQIRKPNEVVFANSRKQNAPIHTDKELAKLAGVSTNTLYRSEVIMKKGTPEQIERARMNTPGNSMTTAGRAVFLLRAVPQGAAF